MAADHMVQTHVAMARAWQEAREILAATGGQPVWREGVVTDNGNWVLDVHGLRIEKPIELETRISQIAGVVTVGLFAHRPADLLILGGPGGIRELRAARA